MGLRDKLVSFPEEILDALEEYKQKTGIPATDYIRNCVCRKMITDGLIYIHTKYIVVEKESGDNGNKNTTTEADNLNKFCDGEKCEIPVLINKNC